MDFFSTWRGRVGYTENNWLLFGTAGLAVTEFKSQTNFSVQQAPFFVEIARPVGNVSTMRYGLAVGGGVEYLFASHWSAKAEYEYIDFGTLTYNLGPFADTLSVQTRLHILRAGLNYKLN
jgi:outer membrane immunogenic protein